MKSYVFLNEMDFSVLLRWNSTWGFYSTFYKRSWADYHCNATEALFFVVVIFRKIKDCDLICLSAIFLSALIGEGKSSSRFQLFGEAANHLSRPVSVISLQSLRDEQHRWSTTSICFLLILEGASSGVATWLHSSAIRTKAVQSAENNSASTLPTAQIQKRRLGLTSESSSRWGDILDPWRIDESSYEDKSNISNKLRVN